MHKVQIENLARRWRDLVGSWTATTEDLKKAEHVAADTLTALPILRKYGMPLHFVNKTAAVMEVSALGLFANSLEDVPSIFGNCCFLCDQMGTIEGKAAKAQTWPEFVGSIAPDAVRQITNEIVMGNVQANLCVSNRREGMVVQLGGFDQEKGLRFKLDELVKEVRGVLYSLQAIRYSWAALVPICEDVVMLAIYDADRAIFLPAFYDSAGRLTTLKTDSGKKIAGQYAASIHAGVIGYKVQKIEEVMP